MWLDRFISWASLLHDQYGPEIQEAIRFTTEVKPQGADQMLRSRRLFHLLQQGFAGCSKVDNLIRSQVVSHGVHESNGFEFLRLLRREFAIFTRGEALHYREAIMRFSVSKPSVDGLMESLREIQMQIESYHVMLEASLVAPTLQDLRLSEGDQFLLYLRNLPERVREHVQMVVGVATVAQLWVASH